MEVMALQQSQAPIKALNLILFISPTFVLPVGIKKGALYVNFLLDFNMCCSEVKSPTGFLLLLLSLC